MKTVLLFCFLCLAARAAGDAVTLKTHPDTTGWAPLFAPDLADAEFPAGVWTVSDGVLTASKDAAIWTKGDHENFLLDLEFKTDPGANSGVLVYCSDTKKWIPNAVEIQILDDDAAKWKKGPANSKCGALYGHSVPLVKAIKPAGDWNHMTVACRGKRISVLINGALVTDADLSAWTSAKTNPDGSPIPAWLNRPFAELATKGRIGLQGKHAGAAIFFRNIRLHPLE